MVLDSGCCVLPVARSVRGDALSRLAVDLRQPGEEIYQGAISRADDQRLRQRALAPVRYAARMVDGAERRDSKAALSSSRGDRLAFHQRAGLCVGGRLRLLL